MSRTIHGAFQTMAKEDPPAQTPPVGLLLMKDPSNAFAVGWGPLPEVFLGPAPPCRAWFWVTDTKLEGVWQKAESRRTHEEPGAKV